ncbi:hypothetical protein GCM10029963_14620 [Micromonospora andamanensis]
MQQRPLGRSGLAVSRLALGTMTWGRDTDADDAAAQLKSYLDAGGNLIDTADVYGDGDAESVIGSLLGTLVPRDELLIATKAGLRPGGGRRRDGSRGHLLRTLDASLRRLGTDHVDLFQVHGYDPQTPLEETLAALDHAVASGRVRYVGVSNFSGWQTARAAAWQAAWPGRAPVVAAQVEYSLLERGWNGRCCPPATPSVWVCCPGRRWAVESSPASTGTAGQRTPGPFRRISSVSSLPTSIHAAPASWRRWPPPRAVSASPRWRWRWPGSGTDRE